MTENETGAKGRIHWLNGSQITLAVIPLIVLAILYFLIPNYDPNNPFHYKNTIENWVQITIAVGAIAGFIGSFIAVMDAMEPVKFARWKTWGAILRLWGAAAAFIALYLSSLIFFM